MPKEVSKTVITCFGEQLVEVEAAAVGSDAAEAAIVPDGGLLAQNKPACQAAATGCSLQATCFSGSGSADHDGEVTGGCFDPCEEVRACRHLLLFLLHFLFFSYIQCSH